ncbi:hypothetical protein Scep_024218 [Stephania cephalantha]|uniref:Uncharacterized protein n=1 Tax=Stephania cephalantha TaxID=152367 RepID=A0AAP0F1M0_9MAGN
MGSTPFRFENIWLGNKEFKRKFIQWWTSGKQERETGHLFMLRLKQLKKHIVAWNKSSFVVEQMKRSNLIQTIAQLDEEEGTTQWTVEQINQRKQAKLELEHMLLLENRVNQQKMKVK